MCFRQEIHRVNCITFNKVDGLEALVGGCVEGGLVLFTCLKFQLQ